MPSKATKPTNKKPDKTTSTPSSTRTPKPPPPPPPPKPPKEPTACSTPPTPPPQSNPSTNTTTPPFPLQQRILDLFSSTFPVGDDDDDALDGLNARIRRLKSHLYARDFGAAFGACEGLREAYAVRWSAGRAVGYAGVFSGLGWGGGDGDGGGGDGLVGGTRGDGDLTTLRRGRERGGGGWGEERVAMRQVGDDDVGNDDGEGRIITKGHRRRKVVCVGGGGGAELVGLAAWLKETLDAGGWDNGGTRRRDGELGGGGQDGPAGEGVECVLVDVADWKGVTEKLAVQINASLLRTTDDGLSGSEKGQQQHEAKLEDGLADLELSLSTPLLLQTRSVKADILTLPATQLRPLFSSAHLVTIMFTLNELYTSSNTLTTTFLLRLTDILAPGAMLLVLDSPGSYSTVGIGADGKERKYPMAWLLDHTLLVSASGEKKTGTRVVEGDGSEAEVIKLGAEGEDKGASDIGGKVGVEKRKKWEKVEGCDSRWCRLAKGLRYPIKLEDMRYQLHLYRRM